MSVIEITLRLALSICVSAAIGYDREFKNRPAGLRTHILVCVGACVISMIQDQITLNAIEIAILNPAIKGVVRSDQARLIAQVVSGIGFLGAGTIIITKHTITGLTTAASLWTTACLGLAAGLGYYSIVVIGFLVIIVVLSLFSKIIELPTLKKLEIQYTNKEKTKAIISDYFEDNHIVIKNVDFDVTTSDTGRIYTNIYTINTPKDKTYTEMIEELSLNNNIRKLRLVDV